jgi:uncharacterized protein
MDRCAPSTAAAATAPSRETGKPVPGQSGMPFRVSPGFAAWEHRQARAGFEVVFLPPDGAGRRVEGATTAVEDGEAWVVQYCIELAPDWTTCSARVVSQSAAGVREVSLEADGAGRWTINGAAAPELDGCLDVDLESSALTNAFPVHRLGLEIGEHAQAPAAYVRAVDVAVERLEQHYVRLDDDGERQRYGYSAPRFGFSCELLYDAYGLVLDYPGIAVRAT